MFGLFFDLACLLHQVYLLQCDHQTTLNDLKLSHHAEPEPEEIISRGTYLPQWK